MSESQSIVEYRDIPEFPGYRAGSDGTIWSCRSRNGRGPLKTEWRRLAPRINPRGYKDVLLYYQDGAGNRKRTLRTVHSLVLEAFVGPRPAGQLACHGNDDPSDNRKTNLKWGTPLDNAADAIRNGRQLRGEDGGNAKLTATQVTAIRKEFVTGASYAVLAVKYGVGRTTIARIIKHHTWWCMLPGATDQKPPPVTVRQVRQSSPQ